MFIVLGVMDANWANERARAHISPRTLNNTPIFKFKHTAHAWLASVGVARRFVLNRGMQCRRLKQMEISLFIFLRRGATHEHQPFIIISHKLELGNAQSWRISPVLASFQRKNVKEDQKEEKRLEWKRDACSVAMMQTNELVLGWGIRLRFQCRSNESEWKINEERNSWQMFE